MYLQANPGRGRSQEEQEDLKARYKPGEQVLPQVTIEKADAADERMLAEVREMSLRDVGVRVPGSYERGTRHRTTERRRDPSNAGPQERRHQQTSSHPGRSEAHAHRQIGHQSSLRSLMSSSDIDSSDMEEEILRLVDEGWLDGIDLNNLDTSQVDELSERIAEAYRRRHGHRNESENAPTEEDSRRSRDRPERNHRDRYSNRSNRPITESEQGHSRSHPPVSRPRLLEAYPIASSQQRRASSEQRRQSSPSPRSSAGRLHPVSQNQASRSATDLSERPPTSSTRPRPTELSGQGRRTTDPNHISTPRSRTHDRSESTTVEQTIPANSGNSVRPVTIQASSRPTIVPRSSDPGQGHGTSTLNDSELRQDLSQPHEHLRGPPAAPLSSGSIFNAPKPFVEPSIVCNRCDRQNIEYELYWNCSRCHEGKYNLCSRCYRLGRGCLHWYGFGYAALQRYQRDAKDSSKAKDLSPPHSLIGHQYKRPEPEVVQSLPSEGGRMMTRQDPAVRLQSGAFCASCSSNANACFWKCGSCNEGEWGFCNECVNQGRCCSHPLLPVAHKLFLNFPTSSVPNSGGGTTIVPALGPRSSSNSHFLGLSPPNHYVPLSLSTKCNICRYPIPPSNTRFHCPQCNGGDFNMCTTSYLKLISAGHVSIDDGDKGWRKCLNGHRMTVVGFEDSSAGQRRLVVQDLVGGLGLKNDGGSNDQAAGQELSWQEGQQRHVRKVFGQDAAKQERDSTTTTTTAPLLRKYPPSGGTGMRALAVWGYWPEDVASDELSFPRGAEIREVEDINGDWFLGSYAGKMGLFPGNHVRVLDALQS
ncbi:MAG: hypothetical protein Q9186_006066 [Xanthomendoza sp. 1 TL-2023]